VFQIKRVIFFFDRRNDALGKERSEKDDCIASQLIMQTMECIFCNAIFFFFCKLEMPGQGIGTFEEDADCSIDLLKICVLVGSFLLRVSDGMISVYFFAQNS